MVNSNSMATRSSLELMLDKLQQLEDQPKDVLPGLPVRPVSRARLPRARKALQLDFQRRNSEENIKSGVIEGKNSEYREIKGNEEFKISKEKAEKGISNIQKCYKGHRVRCYYKKLNRGVIALQSFARGENVRKDHNHRIKRLRAIILIQKHTRNYIHSRLLKEKHVAAIASQSDKSREERKTRDSRDLVKEDEVRVPYSVVIDLRKRVLRTEAKVREKNEENIALKMQIHEMDKKWKRYEERMKSMEKRWQDELTYIQESLAAAKKNQTNVIKFEGFDFTLQNYNHGRNSNIVRLPSGRRLEFSNTEDIDHNMDELKFENNEDGNRNEVGPEQVPQKLHTAGELRKLKERFKAWKKDYRYKLREAQSSFKKLETAKSQKKWWGRFSQ